MRTHLSIKNIFQVLIRDDQDLPSALPEQVRGNIESIRKHHPEAAHHFLSGNEIRSFIATHFDSDVVAAYDLLTPYSYKCNLARYCLLFVHGGLYVDLGVRFLARLEPPREAQLVAFRSDYFPGSNPWSTSNSIIFASSGRPELRMAIDLIVQNCKNRYYGKTPHDPGGPSVFGRAIALCNNGFDYWIGDASMATSELENRNVVYVTPDGTLLALRTKRGNIEELDIPGTNNYSAIWRSRQAYGERTRCFGARDMSIRGATRMQEAILFEPSTKGGVIYGPYTPLPAGRYMIDLWFDPNTRLADSTIDVCADAGADIIKVFHPHEFEIGADGRVSFEFVTRVDLSHVEVRLHLAGMCDGRFLKLEIA